MVAIVEPLARVAGTTAATVASRGYDRNGRRPSNGYECYECYGTVARKPSTSSQSYEC